MCELNARIAAWREALSSRLSVAELNELDDHLHEALAALPGDILSPEERFLIATHRLGEPAAIANEFAKARPARVWRERALWMVGGYVAVGLFSVLTGYIAVGVESLLNMGIGADYAATGAVVYLVDAIGMILLACLAVALIRGERDFRVSRLATRKSGVMKGMVVAAGALLLLEIPGAVATILHFSSRTLTPNQLRVFADRMYCLALGNNLTHSIVVIALIAAAPWLVARERSIGFERS
jgi:hypothetical protein